MGAERLTATLEAVEKEQQAIGVAPGGGSSGACDENAGQDTRTFPAIIPELAGAAKETVRHQGRERRSTD